MIKALAIVPNIQIHRFSQAKAKMCRNIDNRDVDIHRTDIKAALKEDRVLQGFCNGCRLWAGLAQKFCHQLVKISVKRQKLGIRETARADNSTAFGRPFGICALWHTSRQLDTRKQLYRVFWKLGRNRDQVDGFIDIDNVQVAKAEVLKQSFDFDVAHPCRHINDHIQTSRNRAVDADLKTLRSDLGRHDFIVTEIKMHHGARLVRKIRILQRNNLSIWDAHLQIKLVSCAPTAAFSKICPRHKPESHPEIGLC